MSSARSYLEYERDLLLELVNRDLKKKYKRSVLGIGWSLVTPLTQTVVLTFLFQRVIPLGIPNYAAYVLAGVLAWNWFSNTLGQAPSAVVGNPELVRRPGFPVWLLPPLIVATNSIQFLLALPLLAAVSLVGGGTIGISILALPAILAAQAIFTLGLSFLAASIHVRFRDTQYILNVAVMLAFYLTPVFYRPKSLPEAYRFLFDGNPMAILLDGYRSVFLHNEWPDLASLSLVFALGILLSLIGFFSFQRASLTFVEEL